MSSRGTNETGPDRTPSPGIPDGGHLCRMAGPPHPFRWAFPAAAALVVTAVCLLLLPAALIHAQQPKPQAETAVPQQKSLDEERLQIIKGDIQQQLEANRKLKRELEEERKALEGKGQEQVAKVARMYESMQPDEAAQKLEKMDEETAVIILNAVKPKAAGKILAQMSNDRGASLSKRMIKRARVAAEKPSQ